MSRMNSDQSPCASLAKAALNPNQECGGLDYVTDMCDICFYISEVCFLVFEWCTRICSGNMSAHDIMVCNEKQMAALCGNPIGTAPAVGRGRCSRQQDNVNHKFRGKKI